MSFFEKAKRIIPSFELFDGLRLDCMTELPAYLSGTFSGRYSAIRRKFLYKHLDACEAAEKFWQSINKKTSSSDRELLALRTI